MSNIIRLNETAPNSEWIVMSNQGTDCFLDLLITAADALEKTENQKKLISFLKNRKGINDIAPGTAGFDLEDMPWYAGTLKDDAEFLLRVAAEAQNERPFKKLPYDAAADIVFPWLKQFAGLVRYMKREAGTEKDFGMLNLNSDEVTYTYKNETYQLYSHPYEPCLYLYRGDELVCALHNAYNPEQLVKAFSAGETVKTNYGKDYDKEFDEAGFCRVLAAALDSGRDDMDLFDATKLAKKRIPINSRLPCSKTVIGTSIQ